MYSQQVHGTLMIRHCIQGYHLFGTYLFFLERQSPKVLPPSLTLWGLGVQDETFRLASSSRKRIQLNIFKPGILGNVIDVIDLMAMSRGCRQVSSKPWGFRSRRLALRASLSIAQVSGEGGMCRVPTASAAQRAGGGTTSLAHQVAQFLLL